LTRLLLYVTMLGCVGFLRVGRRGYYTPSRRERIAIRVWWVMIALVVGILAVLKYCYGAVPCTIVSAMPPRPLTATLVADPAASFLPQVGAGLAGCPDLAKDWTPPRPVTGAGGANAELVGGGEPG